MKKKTTNTENNPNPLWLLGGNPNAIEQQEAEGQKELIESQQLPRKCNHPSKANATEMYHKMGIKTHTSSKGDDLFIGVTLPDGWKKEATDHSMWNKLVDDKGRVRAMFFYKAAFYDRDAFVNFNTRFHVEYMNEDGKEYYCVRDKESDSTLFTSSTINTNSEEAWKESQKSRSECHEWLKENFPDWEDVSAYWS